MATKEDVKPVAPPVVSPKDELKHLENSPALLRKQIEALEEKVAELAEREAKHFKRIENFLAKFGTYFDSTGRQSSLFVVNEFVTGGANGLALTARQGVIEEFALPLALSREDGLKFNSPFWVPEIIPEQTAEDAVELFGAEEPVSGADNKASA